MDEVTKLDRNARVQSRYDELMREGKHGHYETMFRVAREEVEAALTASAARPSPSYGDEILIRAKYNANTSEDRPPRAGTAWVNIEGLIHGVAVPLTSIVARSATPVPPESGEG